MQQKHKFWVTTITTGFPPERPFKSTDKISTMELNYGDVVLFRRGEVFRGLIKRRKVLPIRITERAKKPSFMALFRLPTRPTG